MAYIVDGLMYDEYPDEMERLANQRLSRHEWKQLSIELLKRIWKLEARIEELEAQNEVRS